MRCRVQEILALPQPKRSVEGRMNHEDARTSFDWVQQVSQVVSNIEAEAGIVLPGRSHAQQPYHSMSSTTVCNSQSRRLQFSGGRRQLCGSGRARSPERVDRLRSPGCVPQSRRQARAAYLGCSPSRPRGYLHHESGRGHDRVQPVGDCRETSGGRVDGATSCPRCR